MRSRLTPHPGPYRFIRVDSESIGIVIALGFIVMGVISIPIAKWFLLGALLIGGGVALLLRLSRK
jgi:hypothetical protein